LALIGQSLEDLIVEPRRAALVAGFDAVKAAAQQAGALGCSLSGSGPSVFAWCAGRTVGELIRERMMAAFATVDVESRGWVSPVNAPGARVEHEE
jgi:homoserine kinase